MVAARRPLKLLAKLPVPKPSVVLVDREIVGAVFVSQTMPLAVIAAPPSLDMLPPLLAVFDEMAEIAVVEIVGGFLAVTSSFWQLSNEQIPSKIKIISSNLTQS